MYQTIIYSYFTYRCAIKMYEFIDCAKFALTAGSFGYNSIKGIANFALRKNPQIENEFFDEWTLILLKDKEDLNNSI